MVATLAPPGWKATAAALNRRVSLFAPADLAAGYSGDIPPPDAVVVGRPAAILAAGGSEGPAAGALQAGGRMVIVLRFERALAAISTAWTVQNDRTKRRYNILQVDDTEAHDRWIYLLCEYGKEG